MEEVGGRKSRALSADGTAGTSVPRLYLRAEVPWRRTHPKDVSGARFDGCHGGALEGSDSEVPSYFIIHANRDGNVANILWAFDVYTKEKGRNKTAEYFRLWSSDDVTFVDATDDDNTNNPCPLTPAESATCHVAGPFEIWHYYPTEQIGVTDFSFDLTITPHE